MNFSLILSGHYDRDPGLDQYIMVLLGDGKQLNEWRCTSSHANGQQRGDQNITGGLIPPVHHCRNLDHYDVLLNPEDSRHVKGVEGAFYRIKPDLVTTKSGTQRGYFGVHRDAHAPGSLGCPVMDDRNFADFKETMSNVLQIHKVDRIPFFPLYS